MLRGCVALALLYAASASEPVITRAVADGSLATVEGWLNGGGDVDSREPSHNFTMLHVACEKRQLRMDLLLDVRNGPLLPPSALLYLFSRCAPLLVGIQVPRPRQCAKSSRSTHLGGSSRCSPTWAMWRATRSIRWRSAHLHPRIESRT